MPRWIDAQKVTVQVRPRRRVHRGAQDPAQARTGQDRAGEGRTSRGQPARRRRCLPARTLTTLGDKITGKTCAGLYVTGTGKDEEPRAVYLYHVADNDWTMNEYGAQAVVWQTAMNPVVALELLATGAWSGEGCSAPRPCPPNCSLNLRPMVTARMKIERDPALPPTRGDEQQ